MILNRLRRLGSTFATVDTFAFFHRYKGLGPLLPVPVLDPPPQKRGDYAALELPLLFREEPDGRSLDFERESEDGGGKFWERSIMGRGLESRAPLVRELERKKYRRICDPPRA